MRCTILVLALVCMAASQPFIYGKLSIELANRMKDAAVGVLSSSIASQRLGDVSGSQDAGVNVDYTLTNIVISSVSLDGTNMVLSPPSFAKFSLPNLRASMTFAWNYRERAWPHVGDSGTATVQISQTTVDTSLHFFVSEGRAQPSVDSVTVAIGKMDLSVSGGGAWFYNMLVGVVLGQVRDQAERQLAMVIANGLGTQAATFLRSLPLLVKLTDSAAVDVRFVSPPKFGPAFISTAHTGLVTTLDGTPPKLPASYRVPALPEVDNGQMLQFVVSEALFDSAGALYAQQKAFDMTFTKLPEGAPFDLDVDSFADAVPPLGDAYPDNLPLQAQIRAVVGPDFNISAAGVHVFFPIDLAVSVVTKAGPKPAFTLGVAINFDGTVRADGTAVSGDVSLLTAKLSIKDSPVGNFTVTALEQLLAFVINHAVVPKVSETLRAGYPLPVPRGLTLVKPTLTTGPGYVLVSSDVDYSPEAVSELMKGKV